MGINFAAMHAQATTTEPKKPSIFQASREAAAKILEEREDIVLRYETTADARIRAQLRNKLFTHEQIDEMLSNYHSIARLRMSMGIKEGSPS